MTYHLITTIISMDVFWANLCEQFLNWFISLRGFEQKRWW